LSSSIFEIILTFLFSSYDILDAILSEQGTLPKLRVIADFFLLFWVQNPDVWAGLLQAIESVGCAHEDAVGFASLFFCGGPCSRGSLALSFDS